jgi:hypothetical protein
MQGLAGVGLAKMKDQEEGGEGGKTTGRTGMPDRPFLRAEDDGAAGAAAVGLPVPLSKA